MDAPAPYQTAALCNLVAGGFNLLFGLLSFWLLYPLLIAAVGGWQIMVGLKMKNGERDANAKNSLIAGMVASFLLCNPISLLASIYGFMQVGQDEVVGWLEG